MLTRPSLPKFILALLALLALSSLEPCAAALDWQPYTYTANDKAKTKVIGQSARLVVPENPAQPDGAKVDLAVFRLPATTATPGAPIVYLHGGPGGSSVEHLESPDFRAVFAALQQQADVILFDQRGCGQSLPSLLPKGAPRVQTETLATRENFTTYLLDISRTLRQRLEQAGHDPRCFTLPDSTRDIEALRRALGAEKISLFAHSYGTQLAQDYLRQHESSVDRAVFVGARGMDTARKLPHQADEFLARLAALARADATVGAAFPDLLATLDRVLAKLDRTPVAVEMEGSDGKFTLKVGGYVLRFIIAKFYLNDPDNFRYLPKLLDELDSGRRPWSLVFNLGQIIRGGVSFAWFTTDAASGASATRLATIDAQAPTAHLRDALNYPFPDINRVWAMPDLGDAFRAPVHSPVPVLFVAGTLDGITPVEQTRDIIREFSAGHLLVVENGGHNSMLRAPGVPDALAAFLAGRPVPATVALPPATFMPLVTNAKKSTE